MHWILSFDGGCTPNPGKGSCAYKATCRTTGIILEKSWSMIGDNNTNNQAEWEAVINGLEEIMKKYPQSERVQVYGDSKLVIEQLSGCYKVKSAKLKPYYSRWCTLHKRFRNTMFIFNHIYREINTEMDEACKNAR